MQLAVRISEAVIEQCVHRGAQCRLSLLEVRAQWRQRQPVEARARLVEVAEYDDLMLVRGPAEYLAVQLAR